MDNQLEQTKIIVTEVTNSNVENICSVAVGSSDHAMMTDSTQFQPEEKITVQPVVIPTITVTIGPGVKLFYQNPVRCEESRDFVYLVYPFSVDLKEGFNVKIGANDYRAVVNFKDKIDDPNGKCEKKPINITIPAETIITTKDGLSFAQAVPLKVTLPIITRIKLCKGTKLQQPDSPVRLVLTEAYDATLCG